MCVWCVHVFITTASVLLLSKGFLVLKPSSNIVQRTNNLAPIGWMRLNEVWSSILLVLSYLEAEENEHARDLLLWDPCRWCHSYFFDGVCHTSASQLLLIRAKTWSPGSVGDTYDSRNGRWPSAWFNNLIKQMQPILHLAACFMPKLCTF